jgi:hypothetical protein
MPQSSSLLAEYLFHGLWVERLHGGQTQALHHVHRALLVRLEVVLAIE